MKRVGKRKASKITLKTHKKHKLSLKEQNKEFTNNSGFSLENKVTYS
jgi:hypothetical protein